MKLALIGYGKMGKMLEVLAPEYGLQVGLILDEHNNANFEGLTAENFAGIDVAIEFSVPGATVGNVEALTALGVPVVIGTTGWLDDMHRVRAASEKHASPVLWSPNYSVGVNVFFKLIHEAAKLLSTQPDYGAYAWEIHHDEKKDAPSGTLLKLVEEMKTAGYPRPIDVSSNRAGRVPGTHEIGFDSAADTITLRHTARSREGFARGALQAANWIVGKKGFYEFSEILFGAR
ncbi:MAG: 4-hydroxy-tetrahydrodipicolinate reductase [Acidobacteria bacterium]|nr:4-hydroxy-tetrahydrodipicolinate reductase [Acidobacteriota bacterium]